MNYSEIAVFNIDHTFRSESESLSPVLFELTFSIEEDINLNQKEQGSVNFENSVDCETSIEDPNFYLEHYISFGWKNSKF